jgi:hypothetical protein
VARLFDPRRSRFGRSDISLASILIAILPITPPVIARAQPGDGAQVGQAQTLRPHPG